jgi:hypothetical protein
MGVTMKYKIPSNRRAQANVTLLIAALCGKKRPPVCSKCGGIQAEEGALSGRCECSEWQKYNQSLDEDAQKAGHPSA